MFIIPTGLEKVWMIDLPEEQEKWGKTLKPFPISALMASVPADIELVSELSSSHFIQISRAKDVADWIVKQ
jgi:hypothetical protein